MLLIMMVGTLSEKDRDKDKPNIHCLSSLSIIGPTQVMVNLYVRSFEKIDDVKMEFSVQITFREEIFRFFQIDHSLVNMPSCSRGTGWKFN